MFRKALLLSANEVKHFRVAIIPGDGIGQEVIPFGQKCLETISMYSSKKFDLVPLEAGYECFLKTGSSLPESTLKELQNCKGALFGAAATPSPAPYGYVSPIIELRRKFDLYANLRPMRSAPVDMAASRSNVDMEIVRENTEDLYVCRERYELLSADKTAVAERQISEYASLRIAKLAFQRAQLRAKRRSYGPAHVTMVHKANILPLSEGVFRDAFFKVAKDYPDVIYDEHLLDSFVYRITMHPQDFDVILAPNTWGNIVSNAFAPMVGGLGMVEGLNVGDNFAVGEPIHGAPKSMEGKGIANPIAAMRAACALAEHLGKGTDFPALFTQAVNAVIMEGKWLTPDIGGHSKGAELGENLVRKFAQILDQYFSKQPN